MYKYSIMSSDNFGDSGTKNDALDIPLSVAESATTGNQQRPINIKIVTIYALIAAIVLVLIILFLSVFGVFGPESAPDCTADGDCAEGEVCRDGRCVEERSDCTEDQDCSEDETCQNGRCQPQSCIDTDECPSDYQCSGSVCYRSPNPPTSLAGLWQRE